MKTVVLLVIMMLFAALLPAVTLTLSSGIVYKGEILSVANDQYRVKTSTDVVVVFKQEIVKAVSDAGFDVTDAILNMEQTTTAVVPPANKVYIANASAITTPLWLMVLLSIGSLVYALSQSE